MIGVEEGPAHHGPGPDVPYPAGSVLADRDYPLIAEPGDGVDVVGLAGKNLAHLPGCDVPDATGLVSRTTGELTARR